MGRQRYVFTRTAREIALNAMSMVCHARAVQSIVRVRRYHWLCGS